MNYANKSDKKSFKKDNRGVGTRVFQMEEIKETNDKLVLLLIIADAFLVVWGIIYFAMYSQSVNTLIILFYFVLLIGITSTIIFIKIRNTKLLKQIKIGKIGIQGEIDTFKKLKSLLPRNYAIFNDLRIIVENRNAQIDQLIIGPNGIFPVETKSYSGDINIDKDGNIYRNSNMSEKEKNQVLYHEMVLRQKLDIMNLKNIEMRSALIFTERAKNIRGNTTLFFTGYPEKVVKDILSFNSKKKLNEEEIKEIIKKLKSVNRKR